MGDCERGVFVVGGQFLFKRRRGVSQEKRFGKGMVDEEQLST